MRTAANLIPFDKMEIFPENEPVFNTFQILRPAKAGDVVPDFTLEKDNYRWKQFSNGVEQAGPVFLRRLLNKPLVISFYSHHWQAYGLDLLKHLDSLQQQLRRYDANVLIISPEKGRRLEKIAWDNSLSLSFYFDTENRIAEEFGVYSEADPVWNRTSGIDTNVPLLATYVISPYGKILYDHIDRDFSKEFPSNDILSAIGKTTLIQ